MPCHEPGFLQESETCEQRNVQVEIAIQFNPLEDFSYLSMEGLHKFLVLDQHLSILTGQ